MHEREANRTAQSRQLLLSEVSGNLQDKARIVQSEEDEVTTVGLRAFTYSHKQNTQPDSRGVSIEHLQ